jgi:Subtilase family
MAEKPLLLLASPVNVPKPAGRGFGPKIHTPDRSSQGRRLDPQFTVLDRAFQSKSVVLADNPGSEPPELILVIETIGAVQNFFRAVSLIPELKWQFEWDDELDPDSEFYNADSPGKKLNAFAYLMLCNQQAMSQLESLWKRWKKTGDVPYGFGPWKQAFRLLKTIRRWSEEDRIRGTGLDEYAKELAARGGIAPCEIELWFREKLSDRSASERRIRQHVNQAGGQVVTSFAHLGIRYHGLLIEIPTHAIQSLAELRQDIALLKSDDVFVIRPAGQSLSPLRRKAPNEETVASPISESLLPTWPPVAALLDGLPLQNHQLIRDRLIVVNPVAEYAAARREHGTQMASVIIRGDLSRNEPPISRPLVVRPILVAEPDPDLPESMPSNRLVIDVVQEAVRDLVAGSNPAAPTVRVINFSIADRYAQFDRTMSSWARMLDWLSNEHNLLFVASAGNHPNQGLATNVPKATWPTLTPDQQQDALLKAYADDARNRRLRPPAEAMNVLTVGAIADDGAPPVDLPRIFPPYTSRELPAHYSAMGLGPRQTIKPEIFVPGGRLPVRERIVHPSSGTAFDDVPIHRAAGIQVAVPTEDGRLDRTAFDRGTSHAAALTTRNAVMLWDVLQELQSERPIELQQEFFPVLLKAMLVHGASWSAARPDLQRALDGGLNDEQFRQLTQRVLGYGRPDFARGISCTSQRATMLGWGSLSRDQAHAFQIPLPGSLSGKVGWRRATVTLAYFSPISVRSQKLVAADLRFKLTKGDCNFLQVKRTHGDSDAVVRGTVQHEVFEGEKKAGVYNTDQSLDLRVIASELANGFEHPVRYGLAVSIEVREGVAIPVYDEIASRIRLRVGETRNG